MTILLYDLGFSLMDKWEKIPKMIWVNNLKFQKKLNKSYKRYYNKTNKNNPQ